VEHVQTREVQHMAKMIAHIAAMQKPTHVKHTKMRYGAIRQKDISGALYSL
jgi:hypothetical protein